jgi:hypothetical protein
MRIAININEDVAEMLDSIAKAWSDPDRYPIRGAGEAAEIVLNHACRLWSAGRTRKNGRKKKLTFNEPEPLLEPE